MACSLRELLGLRFASRIRLVHLSIDWSSHRCPEKDHIKGNQNKRRNIDLTFCSRYASCRPCLSSACSIRLCVCHMGDRAPFHLQWRWSVREHTGGMVDHQCKVGWRASLYANLIWTSVCLLGRLPRAYQSITVTSHFYQALTERRNRS